MTGLDRPRSSVLPFADPAGARSPRQLAENADVLHSWRLAVQQALGARHLVSVTHELVEIQGFSLRDAEALGVPVDLLECFPEWRRGSRTPFRPIRSGLRLAPAGAGVPLGALRLQLSPASLTIPYGLLLLRALLTRLDPDTRFDVVVEPGADIDAMTRLAVRLHPSAADRVRFVAMRSVTVFAQDNARAVRDADGRPALLVPRQFRSSGPRAGDELEAPVAERALGVPVRRSRLHWEGGNVLHDSERCFVGVDTLAENQARLGLANEETIGILEAEFGMPVAPLGRADQARFDPVDDRQSVSGQASFHIDLDVSLLGRVGRARRPRALVADAARGLDFAHDVLRVRRLVRGHFLGEAEIRRHIRAEYEAHAQARHPVLLEYASALAAHGYRVIGMPDLRVDPKMDVYSRVNLDFGFCNVLPGLRAGRPSVHYFVSGVRALDQDAAGRMRLAGVDPVPVSTSAVGSALMLLQGGLHCCCGPL